MEDEKICARAHWLREGMLQTGSPADFFPFLARRGHVVSLVGGGGKTTLMGYLATCFCQRGFRTVAMTTTKIARPAQFCGTMGACRARWTAGTYAVCGEAFSPEKLTAPDDVFLREILTEADAVVVEADGAKQMACKVPAGHEPVILPESDIVIGVAGLDVLGKTVREACFRPELVQMLLGCDGDHVLTPCDLAKILLSERGTRKAVGDRAYYAVLNKCDDAQRLLQGRLVLEELAKSGQMRAMLTCFSGEHA